MRAVCLLACLAVLATAGTAGAQANGRSWAAPQIRTVVDAGLMASSVDDFRPDDLVTAGELAIVLEALGAPSLVGGDPYRLVTLRELHARLVSLAGLRPEARALRLRAVDAGLAPRPWLGTETVARLLGLRVNHARSDEHRELQLSQPATRAETAFSLARLLTLSPHHLGEIRSQVAAFALPRLTVWQRAVLSRALRLVGSPYVWGGVSERPQQVLGTTVPGGFDCSGLVWRVFKLEPFVGAPALGASLRGRSSFALSGEVARSTRLTRAQLRPADVVFFGARGAASAPSEVGHMGIYLGNGWIVHSSRNGTTLQPLTGWYDTTFAWGRNVLGESGLS